MKKYTFLLIITCLTLHTTFISGSRSPLTASDDEEHKQKMIDKKNVKLFKDFVNDPANKKAVLALVHFLQYVQPLSDALPKFKENLEEPTQPVDVSRTFNRYDRNDRVQESFYF